MSTLPELPALAVRGLGLFLPFGVLVALCLWRAPRHRETAAMIVASAWALCTLVPLNLYATHVGWWTFHAEGALWLGLPVDLVLAWALLWGAVPALLLRLLPVPLVTVLLVWLDVVLMPLAAPVVALGEWWLLGEMAGVTLCLIPALLLAFWTRRGLLPHTRMWAQALSAGVLMVALPVLVLATDPTTGIRIAPPGATESSILGQFLALAALPGLAAAREFAAVGRGTPLPYDPPDRLVTSGPYAYVRNPMQLAMVLVYLVLGLLHPALMVGALVGLVYGAGFAAWHEDGRLRERFGADWVAYRAGVRPWLPRWRPWPGRGEGTLYVAMDCGSCRGVGRWVAARAPTALRLRAAADHPEVLYRLTYESADGIRRSGVWALARAMEHLHLGWALTGWALSLPGPGHLVQLCADAFGAGPRASRQASVPVAHQREAPAAGR
ncbi:isoprenylcysteine carboxylmethyltransferase family protein [Nocardiopsis sp. MG754419]|uniref:methyltransferase family protein n=1 Tax=Nocardiopsis sp. MG754419 TaxID=2259865 RepID=UPI001BA9F582|nr:methyltransferase [Nocardiopsis sp. MG754419]MBR8740588.1 isoprenylcysteine carboxylmethyltransferase family protein [Nocardiopsis sp. MG754419]